MSLPEKLNKIDFDEILNHFENDEDKDLFKNIYIEDNEEYMLNTDGIDDEEKLKNIFEIISNFLENKKSDSPEDNEDQTNLKKELQEQKNNIEKLTTKIGEYEDLLRRKQAEFENFRKRSLREKEEFQKTANMKFIEELLPIIDNFEKALESKDNDNKDSLVDGIMLIDKQFKKVLEAHGVEVIKAVGEEFDPNIHEALHIDESNTDHELDTVISEWAKGYMMHGRVIRHSKVAVAKGTSEFTESSQE